MSQVLQAGQPGGLPPEFTQMILRKWHLAARECKIQQSITVNQDLVLRTVMACADQVITRHESSLQRRAIGVWQLSLLEEVTETTRRSTLREQEMVDFMKLQTSNWSIGAF